MATLTEVRDRVAAVLEQVDGIAKVIPRPEESPPSVLPAIVMQEPRIDFAEGEARRGLDRIEIGLLLLVRLGDYATAQAAMDDYLARSGAKSIRAAIADSPGLGLLDGTSAYIDRLDEYGPRSSSDGTQLLGVVLTLVVRTAG